MTDVWIVDQDPRDANWISDLQRAKGRIPPSPVPPAEQAFRRAVVERAYSPGQKRDRKGRFGSGGGTTIGVSRERPELGGGEVHSYSDLEAARKNPVIAEAERTTTSDLEQLDIDVASQRQVAGVFEGGGEPSLTVKLGPGSTVADIEIAGAYLVRRNEQDSVIVTVGGAEMERLGLTPNATTIRIEGLPTDRASRDRVFEDIQKHTPFASWDEERGTVAVSSFDADIDDGMRANLAGLAATHGGRMTAEPVHERWYFQDEQLRTDAKEYLHPADPSVLRTPDEVRRDHPDDERTAAIPGPRQGGGGPDVGGGAGTGEGAALLGYHPPGPVAEALTPWAYSPGQKRDTKGRFGSGGGGSAAPAPSRAGPGPMTNEAAVASLAAIGITPVDLTAVSSELRGEVVESLINAHIDRPLLFEAMHVAVGTTPMSLETIARTLSATENGTPEQPGGYRRGQALIQLNHDMFLSASRTHEAIEGAHRRGWVAGGTVDHVVQHEVGHIFDAALDYPSDKGARGSKTMGASGTYGDEAERNPAPSDYGKTNTAERFAEHYAKIATGRQRGDFSDAAIVEQLMGKHK